MIAVEPVLDVLLAVEEPDDAIDFDGHSVAHAHNLIVLAHFVEEIFSERPECLCGFFAFAAKALEHINHQGVFLKGLLRQVR